MSVYEAKHKKNEIGKSNKKDDVQEELNGWREKRIKCMMWKKNWMDDVQEELNVCKPEIQEKVLRQQGIRQIFGQKSTMIQFIKKSKCVLRARHWEINY